LIKQLKVEKKADIKILKLSWTKYFFSFTFKLTNLKIISKTF
jgi:hypothetical protein